MSRFSRNKKTTDDFSQELLMLQQTLAQILLILAENALPTSNFPVESFAKICKRLASEVEHKSERKTNINITHNQIRTIVKEQRATESKTYGDFKFELQKILNEFVSALKTSFQESKTVDSAIVNKLQTIEQAVETGNLSAIKQITKEATSDIKNVLQDLRAKEERYIAKLHKKIEQMKKELDSTKAQVQRDGLTGLFNRKALDEILPKTIDLAKTSGVPLTVFMLDIDHFKKFNDTYGHQIGDKVLKTVGETLIKTYLRKDDFVCRYGGEEFLSFCKDVSETEAVFVGERTRKNIEKIAIPYNNTFLKVTISIGYATLSREDNAESIIKKADEALYHAKKTGRNKVVGYNEFLM